MSGRQPATRVGAGGSSTGSGVSYSAGRPVSGRRGGLRVATSGGRRPSLAAGANHPRAMTTSRESSAGSASSGGDSVDAFSPGSGLLSPDGGATPRTPRTPGSSRLHRRRSSAGGGRGLHNRVTVAEVGMQLVTAKASYVQGAGGVGTSAGMFSGTGGAIAAQPRPCFPDVPLPYTGRDPLEAAAAASAGARKHSRSGDGDSPQRLFKRQRQSLRREAPCGAGRVAAAVHTQARGAVGAVQRVAELAAASASAAVGWARSAASAAASRVTGSGSGADGGADGSAGAMMPVSDEPAPTTRLAVLPRDCPARDVAWHPMYMQAAVALHDGTVSFFGLTADWEPSSTGAAVCGEREASLGRGGGDGRPFVGAGRGGAGAGGGSAVAASAGSTDAELWPSLRHEFQRDIARIAWQPLSGNVLAVACRDGICLWRRKRRRHGGLGGGVPCSALWWCTFHTWPCSTPHAGDCGVGVGDLAWSACGRYLASCCPRQDAVVVWDMAVSRPITLACGVGGGVTLLRWSPCGGFLFAGTTTATVRVWDTVQWRCFCEELPGPATDASFSPRGDAIVVATAHSPNISCLTIQRPDRRQGLHVRLLPAVIPASDDLLSWLEGVDTVRDDGVALMRRAGLAFTVRELVWDATGERLAVAFSPPMSTGAARGVRAAVKHGERAVALYAVREYPALEFDMRGLVFGPPVCGSPALLRFAPSFTNGALLSAVYNVPISPAARRDGKSAAGIVRCVPLFFMPAKQTLSSFPGIWLPNAMPSRRPAALTAASAAVAGGMGGGDGGGLGGKALLTGDVVHQSARLRDTEPPHNLSRRASTRTLRLARVEDPLQAHHYAVTAHHASVQPAAFGEKQLCDLILAACGVARSSYGAPGHRRRTQGSIDRLLKRVRVFALPSLQPELVQKALTDVARGVEWGVTSTSQPQAEWARVTLQRGGKPVRVQMLPSRFAPVSQLVMEALSEARVAAARPRRRDSGSSTPAASDDVGGSVGRRAMRRTRSVGFDSGGSPDASPAPPRTHVKPPVADVGKQLDLLTNVQRRLARKKVVASVCRVFATGAWPPRDGAQLRVEPAWMDAMRADGALGSAVGALSGGSDTRHVVVVSVQMLRLDIRGLEFDDFVRWRGDGIGDSGASGTSGGSDDGSASDAQDGAGEGGVVRVGDDLTRLGLGGDGTGRGSGADDTVLFPHYYPHGRPRYAQLERLDGYPDTVDPQTGTRVYLDEAALMISLREDLTLWLTAFDCMVREENEREVDRPLRRGYLKIPAIGFATRRDDVVRAACILGRKELDLSSELGKIMLYALRQVLTTVRFDYLAFIEFVDESDTGEFTPSAEEWGDAWFVDDVRGAEGFGGPGRVRVVRAAAGSECRDVLEFTDEEHASFVCGMLLPVDGFALAGNTPGFDTPEGCVGNCTDLRILQSYVHNYHLLDMQRYTTVQVATPEAAR